MKKKYHTKNRIFNLLLFIILLGNSIYSQCPVTAPADVTINCGSPTTITATTTAVTYNVVTSACPPVAITGTNAFPTTCDDCVTGQIPIGFPFNFYGNIYTTGVISSNGILGFGATFGFTGYSSFAIPALGTPNNYIAGFFADIDIRYGGTITYQTVGIAPNRRFVVSYNNVVPYNSGSGAGTGTASFQIVLNETGSFQVIVSQLSANWLASTSGALATSGAENDTGTYAFPVPGRNATDWPGIVPGNQDCTVFNPQPCVFQRWQQGATIVSVTPALTISPTTNTTYTAYWNCGGSLCNDDTVVNVTVPSYNLDAITNNTNCSSPNGSISFNTLNLSGPYNLAYNVNGSPTSQTVTPGGGASIAQGALFNTGVLATTDPTWNRNSGGTFCGGAAGTTYYYDVFPFTVSTNGSYTLNMCTPGTNFDAHASLYQNGFNGLNPCGTATDFIIADDDSNVGGNCEDDSSITATLSTGVTYYLVSTSFGSLGVGNYEWTFTGPAAATLTVGAPKITISNLSAGTYSNFQLNTVSCGILTIPGPFTVLDTSAKTWSGTTDTNWSVATNWSGGVIPNNADCVIIPNVTNDPIVSGASYQAFAGTLTIQNGGNLTINSSNFIAVTNGITVNTGGIFIIENSASILQTNNTANSGNVTVRRISNLRLQDYCYWSSPVGNNTTGTFPVANISPLTPAGYIFKWETTTLNANGGQGNWVGTAENMIPTTGYIVRAPNGFSASTTTPLTASFIGTPSNGPFTTTIFRGIDYTTPGSQLIPRTATDDNWNLIGNPYPSAIGVKEFMNLAANSNIVGGVRIWTHAQLPTNTTDPFYQNFVTNYYPADYTTINLTGATSGPGDYKIGSGQGFMVLMAAGAAGSATVTFNNSMRSATFANNQFYRSGSPNKTSSINDDSRIWLDLVDSAGNVSRTLVGYINGATQDEDRLYDSFTDNKPTQNFYSLINDDPMLIQGRTLPFSINDEVPLGIKIPTNGTYNIAIAAVDGLFTGGSQIVYLEDKLLNMIHNLTASQYEFTANLGTINNRFVLRYTESALSSNELNYSNEIKVFENNGINITSTNETIKEVIVYDVLGKTLLDKKNISKHEIVLNELRPTTNILIVKVKLTNDTVVIKKLVY